MKKERKRKRKKSLEEKKVEKEDRKEKEEKKKKRREEKTEIKGKEIKSEENEKKEKDVEIQFKIVCSEGNKKLCGKFCKENTLSEIFNFLEEKQKLKREKFFCAFLFQKENLLTLCLPKHFLPYKLLEKLF